MVKSQDSLLWGATVCAHAVEGADFNADWWRWEQRPSHIQGSGTSEIAADHLNRYTADLNLAKKFGLNALQYGISWARVVPERGQFDEGALRHYEAVFQAMGARGIAPICVLQEHSLPAWFSQMGAWEHPEASACFLAFVTRVYETIGAHCAHWIPHFEPLLWLSMAYGEGRWPAPRHRKRHSSALAGVARAHQDVWDFLKTTDEGNRVGISIYAPHVYATDEYSPWDDRIQARTAHRLFNALPASFTTSEAASRPYCFLALSTPGTLGVHAAPLRPKNGFTQFERVPGNPAALDEATPEASSMIRATRTLSRLGVPMLLTGAGVATADDDVRTAHLLDHVDTFLHLRETGCDMMGFCYHTLLDGFAWQHGYHRRLGLVHVDWKSLARTPNPSAFLYQDIVKAGAIRPGAVARFASGWHAPAREVH